MGRRTRTREESPAAGDRKCGLCGKAGRLTTTECCGQVICDDEHTYKLFTYARNSCSRNHRRYTICGFHHAERHGGPWAECTTCPSEIPTEMYVHYGTNEYNFVRLENPPTFDPTRCSRCNNVIDLSAGGYSRRGDALSCYRCTLEANPGLRELYRR